MMSPVHFLFNFSFTQESVEAKSLAFAQHIINSIEAGKIPVNTALPALKVLKKNNKCSTYILRKTFILLQEKNYLIVTNGKNAVTTLPTVKYYAPEQIDIWFHATSHCVFSGRLTTQLIHQFHKDVKYDQRRVHAGEQNSVEPELFHTLALQFNRNHYQSYTQANIYYMHDDKAMLCAIGKCLNENNPGVVVVPKNIYRYVPLMFKAAGLEVVEVQNDHKGICIEELLQIIETQQVIALMTMTRASYPYLVDTATERIAEIFKMRDKNPFTWIELNFTEPWLNSKINPVLQMAGKDLRNIIYVWRPDYLVYESSQICAIAAEAQVATSIRKNAIELGKAANHSFAVATNNMIKRRMSDPAYELILGDMPRMRQMVYECLLESGFIELDGVLLDMGDSFFLKPKKGKLKPGAFNNFIQQGIKIVNPKDYGDVDESLKGIRLELAYHVHAANFKLQFKAFLRIFKDQLEGEN
jgi:DNA-binding transcriptional regulator YhcF (GntR family)